MKPKSFALGAALFISLLSSMAFAHFGPGPGSGRPGMGRPGIHIGAPLPSGPGIHFGTPAVPGPRGPYSGRPVGPVGIPGPGYSYPAPGYSYPAPRAYPGWHVGIGWGGWGTTYNWSEFSSVERVVAEANQLYAMLQNEGYSPYLTQAAYNFFFAAQQFDNCLRNPYEPAGACIDEKMNMQNLWDTFTKNLAYSNVMFSYSLDNQVRETQAAMASLSGFCH